MEQVGEDYWGDPPVDATRLIETVHQVGRKPIGLLDAEYVRAHLDIAGPARSEKNYAEVVPGGTGFAARTLVELAVSYERT